MLILKKIVTPFFSLFLFYQTVSLLKNLQKSSPEDLGSIESFIVAFLLTLFITGVFAMVGFAYPTNNLLPKEYYHIKNLVRLNRTFNILGVKYFRVLLLAFFWGSAKNRKKYFDGTRTGLENFIYQSKQSEFGHLISGAAILIVSVFLVFKGYFLLAVIMTLINIIGNLYPVILQRQHRIRIDRVLRRS